MFRHLNLRLKKKDEPGGPAGVTLHLGRPGEPAAYGGIVQLEVEGDLGVAVRSGEGEAPALISLEAGGRRLDLSAAEFRRIVQSGLD